VRLLGEVEASRGEVRRLRLLQVPDNLLEKRQTGEETDDLLLRALDTVLLGRDCRERSGQ
jgi:hypothetical protein